MILYNPRLQSSLPQNHSHHQTERSIHQPSDYPYSTDQCSRGSSSFFVQPHPIPFDFLGNPSIHDHWYDRAHRQAWSLGYELKSLRQTLFLLKMKLFPPPYRSPPFYSTQFVRSCEKISILSFSLVVK